MGEKFPLFPVSMRKFLSGRFPKIWNVIASAESSSKQLCKNLQYYNNVSCCKHDYASIFSWHSSILAYGFANKILSPDPSSLVKVKNFDSQI